MDVMQATTPTFIYTFPNEVDLTLVNNMTFSLVQGKVDIRKFKDDLYIDGQTVSVYLTQADTLRLSKGKAEMQLNWTYNDDSRDCTDKKVIDVDSNLLQEIL